MLSDVLSPGLIVLLDGFKLSKQIHSINIRGFIYLSLTVPVVYAFLCVLLILKLLFSKFPCFTIAGINFGKNYGLDKLHNWISIYFYIRDFRNFRLGPYFVLNLTFEVGPCFLH